jgi:hypothetical protein
MTQLAAVGLALVALLVSNGRPASPNLAVPLRRGSYGRNVRILQAALV